MTKQVQATTEAVQVPQGNQQVLFLATLALTLCFAVWNLYAPLGPHLREELHLNQTELGLLLSIPALLGSSLRIPMGILTDIYGGRKVFTVLLVFCFFPIILGMYANSYTYLIICGFLFGMAGTGFAIGIPHVSKWYPPERQGLALGIYGAGNLGAALTTLFAERIIHHHLHDHWRNIFPLYAFPLLLMAFVYWNYTSDFPTASKPKEFKELLSVYKKTPLAWVFCLFYWVTFGGFICFSLYLPTYFVNTYGIPHIKAGDLATAFIFTASLIRPFGGYIADRFPGRRILQMVFTIAALCLFIEGLAPSLMVATAAFILFGACLGIGNGVIFKLVPTYFAKETGAVGGLVGAAGGLGGFFTPIILGASKDYTGTYFIGFVIAASFCLICLFLARKEFARVDR